MAIMSFLSSYVTRLPTMVHMIHIQQIVWTNHGPNYQCLLGVFSTALTLWWAPAYGNLRKGALGRKRLRTTDLNHLNILDRVFQTAKRLCGGEIYCNIAHRRSPVICKI